MKAATPKQIRRIDDIVINHYGIASVTLMENAGSAVARVTTDVSQRRKDKKICVVCGKGNNGGDGLVASRHLLNSGYKCDTYLLSEQNTIRGEAKFFLNLLKFNGYVIHKITTLNELHSFIKKFNYDLVVDAIFGTGFAGPHVFEPAKSFISFLNTTTSKVISVDIPSGLNGTSGRAEDVAVRSDFTVTLGLPKTGFFLNDGPLYTGKLIIKNIGFPDPLIRQLF